MKKLFLGVLNVLCVFALCSCSAGKADHKTEFDKLSKQTEEVISEYLDGSCSLGHLSNELEDIKKDVDSYWDKLEKIAYRDDVVYTKYNFSMLSQTISNLNLAIIKAKLSKISGDLGAITDFRDDLYDYLEKITERREEAKWDE